VLLGDGDTYPSDLSPCAAKVSRSGGRKLLLASVPCVCTFALWNWWWLQIRAWPHERFLFILSLPGVTSSSLVSCSALQLHLSALKWGLRGPADPMRPLLCVPGEPWHSQVRLPVHFSHGSAWKETFVNGPWGTSPPGPPGTTWEHSLLF
jgi:hypothetical protein